MILNVNKKKVGTNLLLQPFKVWYPISRFRPFLPYITWGYDYVLGCHLTSDPLIFKCDIPLESIYKYLSNEVSIIGIEWIWTNPWQIERHISRQNYFFLAETFNPVYVLGTCAWFHYNCLTRVPVHLLKDLLNMWCYQVKIFCTIWNKFTLIMSE